MARRHRVLDVKITPEDEAYARKQDKFACLIVRSIQRSFPQATHVQADKDKIRFSVPEDGYRYEFETPKDVVSGLVRPFDKGEPITVREFTLSQATDAWPLERKSERELTEARAKKSLSLRSGPARNQPKQNRTQNRNVRAIGRFTDDVIVSEEVAG